MRKEAEKMTKSINKDILAKKIKEYDLMANATLEEKYIKLLEIKIIARCVVNED